MTHHPNVRCFQASLKFVRNGSATHRLTSLNVKLSGQNLTRYKHSCDRYLFSKTNSCFFVKSFYDEEISFITLTPCRRRRCCRRHRERPDLEVSDRRERVVGPSGGWARASVVPSSDLHFRQRSRRGEWRRRSAAAVASAAPTEHSAKICYWLNVLFTWLSCAWGNTSKSRSHKNFGVFTPKKFMRSTTGLSESRKSLVESVVS